MRSLAHLVIVLAACGDNAAVHPDAPPLDAPKPDAPFSCSATFTGNFSETDALPGSCAMVSSSTSGTTLAFAVPAQALGSDVAIQILLGDPPVAGQYSSESVSSWSAMATEIEGTSRCFYVAGATAVPPGDFTLMLDAIDAVAGTAHGQLMLELAVLPGAENNCGTDNAEMLALAF
jgi:hypothetical protein